MYVDSVDATRSSIKVRTWASELWPASIATWLGKRSAGTERGRPAPAVQPEQPAVSVRFGVDETNQAPGFAENNCDVNSIPYMVYFLTRKL